MRWCASRLAIITVLAILSGCASTAPRPAKSSYGCMGAVVKNKLPVGLPDSRAHCMASGLIARYCSRSEAYMAGIGKELRDLLGPGDAEWRDWRADRAGVACEREAKEDSEIASCCSARGY